MCRKNHLYGWCAWSFGLGLLIGAGLESALLSVCLGVGLIVLGFGCFRKK